ncbi:unnamed protein product, partial [Chrysoparadoxa australica]
KIEWLQLPSLVVRLPHPKLDKAAAATGVSGVCECTASGVWVLHTPALFYVGGSIGAMACSALQLGSKPTAA